MVLCLKLLDLHTRLSDTCKTLIDNRFTNMVLWLKLLDLHAYPIPVRRSLIKDLQITLRKIRKTLYLPEQYLIIK